MNWPVLSLIEFVHEMSLKIAGKDCVRLRVVNWRHLEQEHLIWSLLGSYDLVRVCIEEEGVFQEFSWKASEDEDFFTISLANSCALSVWEESLWNFNYIPFALIVLLVLLNGINVFSSMVCNTAKNVQIFLKETTWAVIVSSNIEIGHFKPKINIWIVHFTLNLRIILLLSWSSDDNKLFAEPACWVSVSGVFHLISLNKGEIIVNLNFKQRVKALLVLLIISSTNHVELTSWSIYTLEVVWEGSLVFQPHNFGGLVHEINWV